MACGCHPEEILDFSANINPLGPPGWLRSKLSAAVESLIQYPDPDHTDLLAATAARYNVAPSQALAGNGSTELLYLLPHALKPTRALIPVPSYADYAGAAQAAGVPIETIPLREADRFALNMEHLDRSIRPGDLVFLGHPNNPTGRLLPGDAVRALAGRHRTATFMIDEAFGDFVEDFDSMTTRRPPNVFVLLSLTKAFAVPGLRVGVAVADPQVASRVRALQPAWSVNSLAQAVGAAALADTEYLARTRCYVRERREELVSGLRQFDELTVFSGVANFLLVRSDCGCNAAELGQRLLRKGIAIRVCRDFAGLDDRFFRLAVRTDQENARLLTALKEALPSGHRGSTARQAGTRGCA
jgi:L-threonine-O-3-phosphate decarboxylase